VRAATAAQLAQRLTTGFNVLLQQVAWRAFQELRKAGRVTPEALGTLIHSRMAPLTRELVGTAAPGLQAFTEQSLRTTVDAVRAARPELKGSLEAGRAVLDRTIAQMILARDDAAELLRIIGFDGPATAKSEKALAQYLKRYGWDRGTVVGDLRSDLLLVDGDAARLHNVDWTSSTKLDRFERTWNAVLEDLKGADFDGDWDALAEAYRRAGKGGVPSAVRAELDALTTHAVRETVIRQAALRAVFGDGWFVQSHEMLYKGLAKLFRS
jgi:hypothetical protein